MKKLTLLFFYMLLSLILSTSSRATPVINLLTGHAYDLIPFSGSWTSAETAAQNLTPPINFLPGHLVTYSDAMEEAFVISLFGNSLNGAWLGFTDSVVEGEWRWIDGTPGIWQDSDNFSFPVTTAHTNWRPSTNEPNQDGNEDYAVYSIFMASSPQWNDLPNNTGFHNSYLVEFEPLQIAQPVPESSILVLFLTGIPLLVCWRKQRYSKKFKR